MQNQNFLFLTLQGWDNVKKRHSAEKKRHFSLKNVVSLTLYDKVYFKGSLLYFYVSSSQNIYFFMFFKKAGFLKHKRETDFHFSEIFDGVNVFSLPPIVKGAKRFELFYFGKRLKTRKFSALKTTNHGCTYLTKSFFFAWNKNLTKSMWKFLYYPPFYPQFWKKTSNQYLTINRCESWCTTPFFTRNLKGNNHFGAYFINQIHKSVFRWFDRVKTEFKGKNAVFCCTKKYVNNWLLFAG